MAGAEDSLWRTKGRDESDSCAAAAHSLSKLVRARWRPASSHVTERGGEKMCAALHAFIASHPSIWPLPPRGWRPFFPLLFSPSSVLGVAAYLSVYTSAIYLPSGHWIFPNFPEVRGIFRRRCGRFEEVSEGPTINRVGCYWFIYWIFRRASIPGR